MIPKEVFLSHSAADRRLADQIAQTLRRHGISVWYSATNILGAQQWHDEIGAALRRCDWLVVVLTEEAVQSLWVKRELCYALQQRRYLDRITPVMAKSCNIEQLSWTLSAHQTIDFRPGIDAGFRELLRVWGIGYQKP